MRIAVIADVHGNLAALEAVLGDIAAASVDATINLGDHLSGPLDARATAERLMALDLPSVRGNHDRVLVDGIIDQMGRSDRCAFDQIDERHLAWLAGMPATRIVAGEIFLCHGTPASDTTYWMEAVTSDGAVQIAPIEHIAEAAEGLDYPLLLCGHTHTPRAVRLADGRLIVNPGSVGCPAYVDDLPVPHRMETGSPDARYAIVEKRGGTWRATFHHVAYDHAAMAQLARTRGRHEWASGLASGWIR